MLDREPFIYPARAPHKFPFDPGVPNKQLWAIGMIVVQWSMTEMIIESNSLLLIAGDADLLKEYRMRRNFQQRLVLWETLLELRGEEPAKSTARALIPTIQALSSQRDEVVHRSWGGGMEGDAWSSGGRGPTTDGGMMPKFGDKSPPDRAPMKWHATFLRLKRMAQEMATLNRDLMVVLFDPAGVVPANPGRPHDDINSGD